ncbi:MAG: DNA-processing protein DprA [Hyphomicrobiales bacterium]|nr:DNA-processing protein DprA [Hyphomicrobiales bacterium]
MASPAPRLHLSDSQRADWVQLIRSDNVGPRTFRGLLNRYGSAAAALEALPGLAGSVGRSVRIATRDDVLREMEAAARRAISFICLGEPEYPAALRAIDAPPPVLAVRGNIKTLSRTMVAMVGARNASAAGLVLAERLSRGIAETGSVIVSGLARGIDLRAHQCTLKTGTIAVLAGGHNRIYPEDHAGLVEQILEEGAVISEMPLEWEPRGRDFPRRNRIVSGLSLAVVVIEAALNSGSLITARFANEQGREVFVVPGSPLDPRCEGSNNLLRQGATLCTRAEDVTSALAPLAGPPQPDLFRESRDDYDSATEPLWDEANLFDQAHAPQTDPRQEMDEPGGLAMVSADAASRITELLGPSPVSLDDLSRLSGVPMAALRPVLIELEIEGRLLRHGVNLVSLVL